VRVALRSLFLAIAVAIPSLTAQSHQFDAVSIKRNRTAAVGSDTDTTPGRLRLANVTLFSVVARAFRVLDPQIVSAPDWLRTERYDIIAVTGDGANLTDENRQEYLQALLADRCHLAFHRETREMRVYTLVPSKSGHRLAAHAGTGEYAMRIHPADDGRLRLQSVKGNMRRLAEMLSGQIRDLVVDHSGLTGEYDFTLEWAPITNDAGAGPSLFTALDEQLGLRLETAKSPTQVVVVDRIERPTED